MEQRKGYLVLLAVGLWFEWTILFMAGFSLVRGVWLVGTGLALLALSFPIICVIRWRWGILRQLVNDPLKWWNRAQIARILLVFLFVWNGLFLVGFLWADLLIPASLIWPLGGIVTLLLGIPGCVQSSAGEPDEEQVDK
jgi:hypothetical protein